MNADPPKHLENPREITAPNKCYAKATTTGWRFSEGGTHEEMLRPQGQEGELREN